MTGSPHQKTPPAPAGHPLWGNLFEFRRNQLDFVTQLSRAYGGLVRIRSLISNDYVITDPTYIQRILIDNKDNYTNQSFEYTGAEQLFGHGLFVLEGDAWARRRRLLQPIFQRGRVVRLAATIQEHTATLLARWAALAPSGERLDIEVEMRRLTLLIAGQVLFGTDLSEQADTLSQLFDVVNQRGDLARNALSLALPWLPTRNNRRYRAAIRQLDEFVYGQIARCRRALAATGPRADGAAESDILTELLLVRDEQGQALTDTEVRDELTTFLFDGSETTSNALSWMWWLLGKNPAARQTLHSELQRVLGGRPADTADLGQLPYIRMCYEEALRLYPPSYLLSRRAQTDDEIGGYHISAKSNLVINIYGVHRHPDWWPEPDSFVPERFESKRNAGRHKLCFIPFGAGPRTCIGYQFSLMEAQLIIATIAQHFHLQPVADHVVEPEVFITLRPKSGFLMQLQRV